MTSEPRKDYSPNIEKRTWDELFELEQDLLRAGDSSFDAGWDS